MEMTRCMLHEKNLTKKFWAEAANTSVFLQNRLPTTSVKNQTSFEAWYGYKPSLNFLKVFGCLCFTYVPQVKRDTLDKKAVQGIFIGYSTISKAYKVDQPETGNVVISRDMHFVENEEWVWNTLKVSNQASNQIKNVERQTSEEDWKNEMVDDIPIRGTRLLSDVYQRCNIVVCEPADFNEAKLDQKWMVAMKEELHMIDIRK